MLLPLSKPSQCRRDSHSDVIYGRYVMIMTGKGELSFPSADPSDSSLTGNYTVLGGDILIAIDTAAVSARGHK
jgi:hypothetical protein